MIEAKLAAVIKQDKTGQRFQALEGVEPACAILMEVALRKATPFKNGREAAAFFGLTRVQQSSGRKEK